MRFRMLGPLQVRTGKGWTTPPAEQQRVVLAVLLTESGRTVATQALVEELWGEQPPRTAVNTVQAYVMRLRRLLDDGVLVTRDRGYELVLDPDDIDVAVFERLIASARDALGNRQPRAAAEQLAQALALWRGPVLADVPETPSLAGWSANLERVRLAAIEDRMAAMLELGRHGEVVDELHRLTGEYPLRERLWHSLMLALHRCGRRAEALAAYHSARRSLVAELGLEPDRDLRELHQMILTGVHPGTGPRVPRLVPAQLPADVRAFTGRVGELGRLDALLPVDGEQSATAVVISAIAGGAGVGKTALAVHWAHRVRGRFADGQLYANLRGYATEPPVPPIEPLTHFLRALGVPAEHVPSDVEGASALYRSLLADQRVLVLLDNASDPDQVRPLLPGGPGCVAVVTSRDQLGGLVARNGAVPLKLDVLTGEEAHALLARLVGATRVGAEPEAAAELATLCGNLPLALRIAAANLAARPQLGIAEYVRQLRENRLDGLQTDGGGVRATFDHSYSALPDLARRLFRLLGLVPGPDATAPAAAALAGIEHAEAGTWLDRLTAAHLVDEHASGRYALHDLVRQYVAERLVAEEPEDSRDAARDRLYAYYLRRVDAAAISSYPQTIRLPYPDPGPDHFADAAEAAAWIDAERANLVATVVRSAHAGPRQIAWRLADALRGYLVARASTVDWQTVAEAGLAAAEADGAQAAIAAAHLGIAGLHFMRGHGEAAVAAYGRAVDHARQAGWAEGEAAALGNTGITYQTMGQLTAAADYLSRALTMQRRLGRPAGESAALDALGNVYESLGRLELAADHHAEAAAICRRLGALPAAARAENNLGVIYHALGRLDDALETLTGALDVLSEVGEDYFLGFTRCSLSEVHRDLGNLTEARGLAEAALAAAQEFAHYGLEAAAQAALASIDERGGDQARAIEGYARAAALARQAGERYQEVDSLIRLSSAHRRVDWPEVANDLAEQALSVSRDEGYRMLEGRALTVLAETRLDTGEPKAAYDLANEAVRIQTETGHRPGRDQAAVLAERARMAISAGEDHD